MAWHVLCLSLSFVAETLRVAVEDPTPVMQWSESPDADLPGIYGERVLDDASCELFRNTVHVDDRQWGVAGLPNSGTNAMYLMMQKNCDAPGLWQVPWGKHAFLDGSSEKSVLPLVLVKDPVQWFGSTCRIQYFPVDLSSSKPFQCPSPLSDTSGSLQDTEFENLFDLWARWNGEYLMTDMPRLVLRFEDLLFAPKATISAACACVGGKVREPFLVLESVPKWGPGHVNVSNRSETLLRFETKRYVQEQVLTDDDWMLMNSTDRDRLMDHFHYQSSARKSSDGQSMMLSVPSDIMNDGDWGDAEYPQELFSRLS